MKKILFYTDTPMLGGAENQMYLLAKYLPKEKYTVTLACSNYETLHKWAASFKEIGCEVIRFDVLHKHDPRHFLKAKELFAKFDLVHVHVWNPASNRYALAVKSFLKDKMPPMVITEHDPFPLNKTKKWIKSFLVRGVSRVIVPSKGAKKVVTHEHPELTSKIDVVTNGIDSEQWESQIKTALLGRGENAVPMRDVLRKEMFQAEEKDKIILCVAELNARKGQRYLIEAFEQVATKNSHVKLFFVGDGPARDEYEYLVNNVVHSSIRSRVKFLGRVQHVAPLMAASDVFVLPSVREAFGLVLLEAAIAKLPIVASKVGGIPEILENEKTALLVPPQNSDELARAIEMILSDHKMAETLTQNAYEHVCKQFHAKEMAMETAKVYDRSLDSNVNKHEDFDTI